MKITKKELEKYLKTLEWIDWDATINNIMTNINVTLGQKKTQKQDKIDLILGAIIEIKKDMVEVKDRLTTLETKVDNLESKVDNLETKVDKLETKVDNLEKDMTQLKSEAKKHGWNIY